LSDYDTLKSNSRNLETDPGLTRAIFARYEAGVQGALVTSVGQSEGSAAPGWRAATLGRDIVQRWGRPSGETSGAEGMIFRSQAEPFNVYNRMISSNVSGNTFNHEADRSHQGAHSKQERSLPNSIASASGIRGESGPSGGSTPAKLEVKRAIQSGGGIPRQISKTDAGVHPQERHTSETSAQAATQNAVRPEEIPAAISLPGKADSYGGRDLKGDLDPSDGVTAETVFENDRTHGVALSRQAVVMELPSSAADKLPLLRRFPKGTDPRAVMITRLSHPEQGKGGYPASFDHSDARKAQDIDRGGADSVLRSPLERVQLGARVSSSMSGSLPGAPPSARLMPAGAPALPEYSPGSFYRASSELQTDRTSGQYPPLKPLELTPIRRRSAGETNIPAAGLFSARSGTAVEGSSDAAPLVWTGQASRDHVAPVVSGTVALPRLLLRKERESPGTQRDGFSVLPGESALAVQSRSVIQHSESQGQAAVDSIANPLANARGPAPLDMAPFSAAPRLDERDLESIADRVYDMIERRLRVERENRGL
jgi:hypothetical protein